VTTTHFEILVEEPSAEAFLQRILPTILGPITFTIHVHFGKSDLLKKLEGRLKGYSHWLPNDWRIIVLVDRDDEDCLDLKQSLEGIAATAGLPTRSVNAQWKVSNRIIIEELEAWYFGEWNAVTQAYPRVPNSIPAKAAFRDSDAILGGTWEALERTLKKAGYFPEGLPKLEVADAVGTHFNAEACSSNSFGQLLNALSDVECGCCAN
jgi:hypothetical protein